METSTLALSVATLVVFVLLTSCWNPKSAQGKSRNPVVVVRSGCDSPNSVAHQQSSYGSGLKNRQYHARAADLRDLNGYGDWGSVAQYQSLEPEVFDSHKEFSHDIGIANSGASMMAETSHSNHINPTVGFRNATTDYHSISAAADARVVNSTNADQHNAPSRFTFG